jgi:hypothetical protein
MTSPFLSSFLAALPYNIYSFFDFIVAHRDNGIALIQMPKDFY